MLIYISLIYLLFQESTTQMHWLDVKGFHLITVQAQENVACFSLPTSIILFLDNSEDKMPDVVLRNKNR